MIMKFLANLIKRLSAKLPLPKVPPQCLDIIKRYEGLRLKPYKDAVGIPTIGYGTTYYKDNKLVALSDPPITEAEAEDLLSHHAYSFYEQVIELTKEQKLNANQLSALTSFSYNLGIGALIRSSLLKKVKANPLDKSIRLEFQRWTKAGGKVLKGLERRRKDEADLYFL